MLQGFKAFIMRGNVVDLAVAVVIGAAFAPIIKTIVDGLLTPIIALIFGKPNLDEVGVFTINNAVFAIGPILTAMLNFVFVAAAVYFFVVVPMQKIQERTAKAEDVAPPAEDIVLLTEIRDALRRG